MARISDLRNRLANVSMKDVLEEAMIRTAQQLVLLQKTQMLFGEDSQGGNIGRYKDPLYSLKKYAENPFAGLGNVDLKFTGQFQNEIFAEIGDNGVNFDSLDPKSVELQNKYGPRIFGLNENSRIEYNENYLKPEFVRIVKDLVL